MSPGGLLFLSVCLLAKAASARGDCCPDDWTGHGNSCYLFIGTKQPWVQASQVCAAHGATLVAVDSAEENNFIRGHLKVSSDLGADMSAWVGGSDMDVEGVWKWMPSGKRISFTYWSPKGEPNGDGDCILIQDHRGYSLHWVDAHCLEAWPFMCEKPKTPSEVIG